MFADIEAILCDWLHEQLGVRTVSELPAELDAKLVEEGRIIRVSAGPGTDDGFTLDKPRVDIDNFHPPDQFGNPQRAAARDLAEEIRTLMITALTGHEAHGGVIALVETVMRPNRLPWDDTNIRRFGATYEVTVHSRP